ncbi:MAG: hypothetical protein OXH00_21355 [Candidatus Poribacteria bacterium]|nr:hypothetical protein [Candidatus Poribacteria bacterium]
MFDLLIPLFLISMPFLIFAYAFSTRKKRKSNKRRKKHHRMIKQCSYEGSIGPLLEAHRENEIAAEAKYIGTIIRVKGTVLRVAKSRLSKYDVYPSLIVILFVDGGSVLCCMSEDEKEQLIEIRIEDEVVVYGVIVGFDLDIDRLILNGCFILIEEKEAHGHQ